MTQKFMFQIQVNNFFRLPNSFFFANKFFFQDLNYDSINDSFITGDFQIQNTNDEDDINETLEADNYEEQFNMGEVSILY